MSSSHAFSSHGPLVVFTWGMMMAAALALAAALGGPEPSTWAALGFLALGGGASFLHLGQKLRAPGSLTGFRHSWLSREALVSGAFAASLAFGLFEPRFRPLSGLLGLLLVAAIVRLYALEAQPAWRTWPSLVAPFLAVGLLAGLLLGGWRNALAIGLADLAVLVFRMTEARLPEPVGATFPGHRALARSGLVLRAALTTTAIALSATTLDGGPGSLAPVLCQSLSLLLDRYAFYALAIQLGPSSEIQRLKAARMHRALAADTEGPGQA